MSFRPRGLLRVVVIAAAWAAGEALAFALGLGAYGRALGLALAVGAYLATRDTWTARGGGPRGHVKYWRGRPVDDSDPPRRG
ncbi:MAG TPA: hypothetical protein VMJ92_04125 [Candidatus Limnocylindrales bacterium]|nr:hypothetical protein [Candidatus Limnocylindrales bacterium]